MVIVSLPKASLNVDFTVARPVAASMPRRALSRDAGVSEASIRAGCGHDESLKDVNYNTLHCIVLNKCISLQCK